MQSLEAIIPNKQRRSPKVADHSYEHHINLSVISTKELYKSRRYSNSISYGCTTHTISRGGHRGAPER